MREHDAADEDDAPGRSALRRGLRRASAARKVASPLVGTGLTPRLLTPAQAAAYCGVSLNHWNAHFRARLSLIVVGRRVLVDRKRLDELLDQFSNTTALPAHSGDLMAAHLRAAGPHETARKAKPDRT